MDFGPDGNLYILGRAGYILKISPERGGVLDRLGEEAIGGSYTLGLTIDDSGNLYVTTQVPAGAVKLDADGNVLETFGVEAASTSEGWPEGEFMFPLGIAVAQDGSMIFIGDTAGSFSYITAFKYP
jgi:streptogramin lyase